jgi:hypothetical protein
MLFGLIALLVFGSSVVSYILRERMHRNRWQLIDLPSRAAGAGAYRSSQVSDGSLFEAPAALRVAAFSCIVYGRTVTFAFIATALELAGVPIHPIGSYTLHTLIGYFVAGLGVGVIAALILSSMVMRVGSDLLLRDPENAFRRTRTTALASLAVHGLIVANSLSGVCLVGLGGRNATQSLGVTNAVAVVCALHALLLLATAYVYRAELSRTRAVPGVIGLTQ